MWVCNNEENSQLGYFWFRRQYHMVPHTYKKNMRAVCLVHPSASVRLLVFFLSYICRTSFWDKLIYADRLEFLDELVGDDPKRKLHLSKELIEYDRFLPCSHPTPTLLRPYPTPPYTTLHHPTPPYPTLHHPTPPYPTLFHSQIHGRIKEGMGFVTFPLQYQAIVFRPFKGQVLDAIVTLVNKMGFFAEVGPLQVVMGKKGCEKGCEKGCWGFWGVFFPFGGGNEILRCGNNAVRHEGEMGHSPNILLSLQVFVSKHAMPSDFAFDPQVPFSDSTLSQMTPDDTHTPCFICTTDNLALVTSNPFFPHMSHAPRLYITDSFFFYIHLISSSYTFRFTQVPALKHLTNTC